VENLNFLFRWSAERRGEEWVCCTVGVETGDIGGVERVVMCGQDFGE
jgi:hypothetical protein